MKEKLNSNNEIRRQMCAHEGKAGKRQIRHDEVRNGMAKVICSCCK